MGDGEFVPFPLASTALPHETIPRELQRHLRAMATNSSLHSSAHTSSSLLPSERQLKLSHDGSLLAVVYPDGYVEISEVENEGKRTEVYSWKCTPYPFVSYLSSSYRRQTFASFTFCVVEQWRHFLCCFGKESCLLARRRSKLITST